MDAVDAFTKLREQIKTCLQSPIEIRAALNIISSTNLDYFNAEQKAEMFRLKGEALQHLGYGDESNTAFSACLSICDSYGKGWLSWGGKLI
jgi:transformation/transcription domain-associated protein